MHRYFISLVWLGIVIDYCIMYTFVNFKVYMLRGTDVYCFKFEPVVHSSTQMFKAGNSSTKFYVRNAVFKKIL